MRRVSALILALVLAVGPAMAQPAHPAEPPPPLLLPNPPDIVREGARRILEGIRRLVDQMPMFEAPRVTPEGDIILKRIRPLAPEGEEAKTPEGSHEGVDL